MEKLEKLTLLKEELEIYRKPLTKASDSIIDNNVSEFPIFIIHQHVVEIGIPIINKKETKGNWSVNASTLEELVTKNLIAQSNLEEFKNLLKKHTADLCLFVLSELGANFIFISKAVK